MLKPFNKKTRRALKPIPKGLVRIYGLIAVIVVLIPEWLAEFAIGIDRFNSENQLPVKSNSWQTLPELRLASMDFRELRVLAMELNIHGYSSESKDILTTRITKCLIEQSSQPNRNRKFFMLR